jgi:hypothetical protein
MLCFVSEKEVPISQSVSQSWCRPLLLPMTTAACLCQGAVCDATAGLPAVVKSPSRSVAHIHSRRGSLCAYVAVRNTTYSAYSASVSAGRYS